MTTAEESPAKVGLAFAGAGVVTSGPHSDAVQRCDAARLIGVYDPNASAAKTLAAQHLANAYGSLADLLADDAVEAVIVATPTAHQFDTTMACMSAGKHVLLEKPVAETVDEIDAMISLAEDTNLVLMPAHNFIYQATLEKGRNMLGKGRLGQIGSTWILYNVHLPEEDADRYVGVVRQIGWHLSYSLLYLLGRPTRVSAASTSLHYKKLDRDDQVMLICEMPDGSLANLWASFFANDMTMDPWTVYYKVIGSKGGFVWSWNEAVWNDDRGPAWGVAGYMDAFAAEVDHFVRMVLGTGEEPLSTMSDARAVMRILEAAERSLAAGGGFQTIDYS